MSSLDDLMCPGCLAERCKLAKRCVPRVREYRLCTDDDCDIPDCDGSCFYSARRIVKLLAQLPNDGQDINDPANYGMSRVKRDGNPMEGQWAVRADLLRGLAYVRVKVPSGPYIEQVVVLAYVGVPVPGRVGKWAGVPDDRIGRLLHLSDEKVATYRRRGIALMVECLRDGRTV